MTGQRIVRCGEGHGARGFTHFDGDALAVGQGHHNRRTGHWRANSGGIGDGATFSHGRVGSQFHRRGVDGVSDIGHRWDGARNEVLEVAAGSVLDGHFDFAGVLVDVIGRCRNRHGAGGFACFDGDHRAVAQVHGDRRARCVGQGRGVSDLATLGHGTGRAERQVGGVGGVGHGGADRGFVRYEIFVVATRHVGDRVGDRSLADQCIVWRGKGHGAGGFTHFDGDVLAVGQRHDYWRTGHRRADGSGVSDGATLSHGSVSRQFHRRGVDGVSDIGHRWDGARNEVLEVAAGSVLDGHFDFAGVLVDVIGRCRNRHGAGGFACFDGDHRAVAQVHGDRRARCVGQRGGVGNLATLGHGTGRAERQVGGVGGISHGGADGRLVGNEVLVVAAADVGDRVGHRGLANQRIVRRSGGHGAGGLPHFDGDALAVGQGHHNGRAGHRSANGGGVGDSAAFGDRSISRQFDGRSINGVGDVGNRRNSARHQVLEVAASSVLDGHFDFAGVFIDVIGRRRNGYCAGGFAGFDGDHRAVAQGHGHRRTGSIGQRRGVNDRTAFSHGPRGTQGQIGGVDGIGDGSRNRGLVGHEIFVVAASHASDRVGQRCVTGQSIVRCGEGHAAGGFTHFDGDVLTIGQRYHNRRASHWRANGGGVGDGAAFSHRGIGAQFDGRSVDGVGHFGHGWRGARNEVLEVAAGGVLDGDFNFAGVFIDVIGRRRNGHGARGLARVDGDHRAVAQGHGHRGLCGVGQGCGVNNRATFGHRASGTQRQIGGVDRVGNGGGRWRRVWHQVFEITAGSVSDRGADGAAVVIDVVGRRRHVDGASGLAGFNSDGRTVRQGDGHRGLRRVGQGRGVSDLPAFDNSAGGGEAHAGGVDRIGNGSGRWRGVRHQVFEVATGSASDLGADGAAIVVDVVWRGRHVDGAAGLAGFNGDGRTVRQGDGDRRLRRVGQSRGVGDLTTLDDGAGGGQGQAGVIDRIGDGGHRRCRVRHQVFEVAAGGTGDGGGDGAAVVIDVVGRGWHVDGAGGLARADGDGRAVRQGDGDRRLRRVGQGRGVSDLTAFGHARPRRQSDGGGVDGVRDLSCRRGGWRGHGDAVAAGGAGDGHVNLGRVVINGVVGGHRHVDGAGGRTGRNHDHRAVGQGDGQVSQWRLGQGRGVHQHAACFGDGRRGAEAQGRLTQGVAGRIGVLATSDVLCGLRTGVDPGSREANGRINAASRGIEHHEAVTAARRAASTCGGCAGSGGFKCGGRVDARSDGLLQFCYRRRSLRGGFGQVSAGVGRVGAPLGFAAQVQGAAISQFKRHGAGQTGVDLVADKQAIALNEYAAYALWGHHEYLTDNAFDDGNNTAH